MPYAAIGPPATVRLVSCLGVELDLEMLPHFLRHYAEIGIAPEAMHFSLHAETAQSPRLAEAERILAEFGAAEPARWIDTYTSDAMWEERRRLQRAVAAPGDWIVNSDIDEHYLFPAPLAEVIAHCDKVGANCVQGVQIDRFAPEGALAAVAPEPALAEQFPVSGEASFHVFRAGKHYGISGTTKLMLHRAEVLPRRGGHNPEGLTANSRQAESDGPRFLLGRPLHTLPRLADPAFRFAFPFQSLHFKWTASRLPTVARRVETPGSSPAEAENGEKVQAYLTEHGRMPLDKVVLRGAKAPDTAGWRDTMRDFREKTAPAEAAPAESAPDPAPLLLSCIGVDGPCDGDLPLLRHWLDHYAKLGIPAARVHVILNAEIAGSPNLARARATLAAAGCAAPELWIGPYTSGEMWRRRRALQRLVAGPQDWIVNADADEFHDYPAPLAEVIALCTERGARHVQGPFVDRVAGDGTLRAVAPDTPLQEQFPRAVEAGLSIGKRPGVDDATGTVKLMLHRADILPSLGGHAAEGAPPETGLYGLPLMRFPRIKSPGWRASLPFRVHHFKWTAGLKARLEARRAAPGASPAGSLYGGRIIEGLARGDGRLPLDAIAPAPERDAAQDWRPRIDELARLGETLRPARARAGRLRAARGSLAAHTAQGWRVRQLTFGSGAGRFHAHSYYDIPVLTRDARRVAAHRMGFEGRWMTPDDPVEIGLVDVERGGFAPIGTSRAWSWQQGPMAQWLPDDRHLVWNDRQRDGATPAPEGDAFVARLHDTGTGTTRTLPRPVYALTPSGTGALSLNMARLDHARPGYGYTGGRGAKIGSNACADDGVWYMDLAEGGAPPRLVLSLARAAEFLAERLPEPERAAHRAGRHAYWFNHAKVSPDGRRFTVKLRWRGAGFEGGWTGLQGVSLTCGLDGEDLALVARGTSHVMWHDAERLYFWHQAENAFVTMRDAVPEAEDREEPFPDLITGNVHIRHIPDAPHLAVYDTPYAEEIDVILLDQKSGDTTRLARFGGHAPPKGAFRCDLHPVPSPDGGRIIVTSLSDGGRQLYVLEKAAA
ncbi:hypothetical protein [Limimaricola pyoseonensis]|nr:hypothetical protein [Limimaricola pyoseonensis]